MDNVPPDELAQRAFALMDAWRACKTEQDRRFVLDSLYVITVRNGLDPERARQGLANAREILERWQGVHVEN